MTYTETYKIGGINFEVEFTGNMSVHEDIDAKEFELDEIINVWVDGEEIVMSDWICCGTPLETIIKGRVND